MAGAARRPSGHRWHAALYDLVLEPSARHRTQPQRRFVAGEARGRVLEIGAGTGSNLTFYDWDRIESLDLTDPDPYMLDRIRPKLARLPLDVQTRVRCRLAPAEALPFPDHSFDTVVATLVFCSVGDPQAALGEVHRILDRGGQLRLLEHVKADGLSARVQEFVQPVYGWLAAGCRLTRRTEEALRAAGFDVQVQERLKLAPLLPAFLAVATSNPD